MVPVRWDNIGSGSGVGPYRLMSIPAPPLMSSDTLDKLLNLLAVLS